MIIYQILFEYFAKIHYLCIKFQCIMKNDFKVALFDLDGVVFDTEPQYTEFWGSQCREFHPDDPGLEHRIKGQTLVQIFDNHFSGELENVRSLITDRLNEFERTMRFEYVAGFEEFIKTIRQRGVKTAVVTSSNQVKMNAVYERRPEFRQLFDEILTSEDFEYSKPHPDCYLKAAARFGATPEDCVVFEDSFNGLKSGRAANMYVVGLSTTNAAEDIAPLCDEVVEDFSLLLN